VLVNVRHDQHRFRLAQLDRRHRPLRSDPLRLKFAMFRRKASPPDVGVEGG
jgi:hypothetical protein